jgi:hypothetical protein
MWSSAVVNDALMMGDDSFMLVRHDNQTSREKHETQVEMPWIFKHALELLAVLPRL